LLKGEPETMSDIFVSQAFDAYAKACITHFRNKDKNDALQEEHIAECVAIGHLPSIVEEDAASNLNFDDDAYDDDDDGANANVSNDTKRKLDILMTFDKHKHNSHAPTLDTYVIKITPPPMSKPAPIPQFKEINLDDPKFKTKDIKPKSSKAKLAS